LSQRIDIHIGSPVDLYDGRPNYFSVNNQYFIRRALCRQDARQKQDDAKQ